MNSTLYKENILDHYKNPRNCKEIEKFTHSAFVNNVSCGDEMEVFLNIEEGTLKEISFKARGCAISIAAMSMLSEEVKNTKISKIKDFPSDSVLKMLGLKKESPRIKCALLGLEALKKALHD
jgi:nitrogen fixation protein NifU and related proteins